ncbi:MAG: AAA family ATPase [Paludibacteraceae bacterium]|nr:AAA family ATPase [Paludibacteraceae bacterium]
MKKFKKKRSSARRKAKHISKIAPQQQLDIIRFDDESAEPVPSSRPDSAALLEVLNSPMVSTRKFDCDPRPALSPAEDSRSVNNADFGGVNKSSDLPSDVHASMLGKALKNRSISALEDSGNKTCEEYEKELENYEFLTMNEAMDQVDDAYSKPLLGPLMHQGDVVGLVAESNVGKTIFAMQLAEFWTSGKFAIEGLRNEAGAQKVCFMSAEMSDTQMKRRYSSEKGGVYRFSDSLIYVDKNMENEEKMKAMVKMVVKKARPDIIIIDSLCQVADSDMTKMTQVKPLIKYFKEIAKENSVTFLIILHTKKRSAVDRKKDKMDKYSLYGSSAITNMFDSLWALDQGLREPVKILTQVKSRDGDLVFNNDNAMIMSIVKDEPDNFLRFELESVAPIGNLLTERKSSESDPQTDHQKAIVAECFAHGVIREPSLLRKYFGLSAGSSCRWIESLKNGTPLNYDYMLSEEDKESIRKAEEEVVRMRTERARQLEIF